MRTELSSYFLFIGSTYILMGIRTEENMEKESAVLQTRSAQKFTVRQLTIIGLLAGITIVLGMTGWGFVPIPPISATILHIPTILGGVVEGPKVGMAVGFLFGAYSMVQAYIAPNVLSFAFMNPIISVLPRMLIGLVAELVYLYLPIKVKAIRIGLAAFLGTATNTILVMSGIYAIYGVEFAKATHIPEETVLKAVMAIVWSHGIPEALLAVAVVTPVAIAVIRKFK